MHNPFDSASKTIRRLKPFSKGESGGANRQPGHSAKVNQQERNGSQAIQQRSESAARPFSRGESAALFTDQNDSAALQRTKRVGNGGSEDQVGREWHPNHERGSVRFRTGSGNQVVWPFCPKYQIAVILRPCSCTVLEIREEPELTDGMATPTMCMDTIYELGSGTGTDYPTLHVQNHPKK
ncbi:hypothetical protein Taro_048095 [Colocasia esculenta]|uniref:Uncharacterized protein n=1 Tax=Colocasia esculenta TaxID=4460 RepID=A0A843WXK8_COLES|nr:hypothetical protein [Colocasia esculenta]